MSDLNTLPAKAAARTPRGAVNLGGVSVPWESWEVENNVFRAADTFRVLLPVAALPADRDPNWFSSQSTIEVEIFGTHAPADAVNYQPSAADSLIVGHVDDITYDPAHGTIELTGRDLTATLIDTKTSEHFANQTASQIATTLAGRHGLTPVVTATTDNVGTYYTQDHVDLNQEQSEWELLVSLANYADFDVYVKGRELHFAPKLANPPDHYAIEWQAPDDVSASPSVNTATLTFTRALTIAKGVSVEVRSWNAKNKKAFTASWPKAVKPAKPGQSGGASPQIYRYTIAGLTQDEANKRAQRLYNQIVQHMVSLSADLPGDAILDCALTIEVRGTGTTWDQIYYPDSVRRSMLMDEGFRMSVTAKNISQDFAQ